MTYDYITPVLTGFCVGIGSVTATWVHDKYIKKRLDKIDDNINKIKGKIRIKNGDDKNGKN